MWELKADDGRVFTMSGETAEDAARRAADLYRVTIVAARRPRIYVGPVDPRSIVG